MNQLEIFTYGVLWRNYQNEQAGRELVRALRSSETRDLARTLILEGGPRLVPLMQSALEAGEINAEQVADCLNFRPAPMNITWNAAQLPVGSGCSGIPPEAGRPQIVPFIS